MGLLKDALVVLFDGRRAYHGYTDSSGQIKLENVIAGNYKIIIVKDGYIHYEGEITVDEDKSVNITLSPIPVYKAYEEKTVEPLQYTFESQVGSGQEQTLNIPSYSIEYEVA